MKLLTGKIILVTGASKGIGAAVASLLASEGAKVIVNYSSGSEAAEKTVKEIVNSGGEAIALQADVSKAEQVERLFDQAIEHYGKIDVLVNNAGIMITKLLKDFSDEEFDRQININLKGTFYTLRQAATKLADNGSIINFSSSVTRVMQPTYAVYVATKGAVEQLTRVFAKEVGERGINVNSISPGPVNTELFIKGKPKEAIERAASMSAFNRLGEPVDIAKVIVFLASDDAKWVSGQNIGINGAFA